MPRTANALHRLLRSLTARQLAAATGGDGTDWYSSGTGQDAPSTSSGTGKTLSSPLLGRPGV